MVLRARQLSNTQRNLFVTNPEIAGWVNDGVKVLYDAICNADRSYYNAQQDYTFVGTSQATAQAALPSDFYLARGVTRFPDTRNAYPVFARNFTLHDIGGSGGPRGGGDPGYYFSGNNIGIGPYQSASSGPWRLTYVPKAPQLTIPSVFSVTVVAGVDNSEVDGISLTNGSFSGGDVGKSLFVTGTADPGNSGEFVITNAVSSTIAQVTPFPHSIEAFSSAVVVTKSNVASPRLDVTMDNYDEFPCLYAAIRIVEKKKQDPSSLQALLGQSEQRIAAMTSGRQAEPEAAPTLWAPSGFPVNGFGPFGSGSDFGP